jgi:dihydroxy-acid dehydratase
MLPPDYLVKRGTTTLPCLGDGRQSGTSASPSILNASPEAAIGGGLALLQTGDLIEVDLNNNTVNVLLSEAELTQRKRTSRRIPLVNQTPWQEIYRKTVTQLQDGATMELDETYQGILAKHGIPRHSH